MLGRIDEAADLFERLLSLRNDLGLLAEEYDSVAGRLVGNFPQGFSHIGLVNTAYNLVQARGPATQHSEGTAPADTGSDQRNAPAGRKDLAPSEADAATK